MSFVNDEQTVVKRLVNPRKIHILCRATQLLVDEVAKGLVCHEIVELVHDAVCCALQLVANLGIVPVLRLRLNAHQHIQIPPPGALLGLQSARNRVDIDTRHVKELGAEVILNGCRCHHHDRLVLELRAQDILLCDLDCSAGLSSARAVNQHCAPGRRIGGKHTAQKLLLRLQLECAGFGSLTSIVAQALESFQRCRWKGLHPDFGNLGVSEIDHCSCLRI